MPRPKYLSSKKTARSNAQKEAFAKTQRLRHSKENYPPQISTNPPSLQSKQVPKLQKQLLNATDRIANLTRKHESAKRAVRREKQRVQQLTNKNAVLQIERLALDERHRALVRTLTTKNEDLKYCLAYLETRLGKAHGDARNLRARIATLKEQIRRMKKTRQKTMEKAKSQPNTARIKAKNAYTAEARKLARRLVQAGCATTKVGPVLQAVAKAWGITLPGVMSARTVSRCVLEGLVAADIQLGYEITKANSLTISQDGTSNRHINYEAHHIALRVPDYSKGERTPSVNSVPVNRLVRIEHTLDHSAERSKEAWMGNLQGIEQTYNNSPLAQRENRTFTMREAALKFKGMNTDHGAPEKSTAKTMEEWKRDETLKGLGQDVLSEKDYTEMLLYLCRRKLQIVQDAGGYNTWVALPLDEQARREAKLMEQIKLEIGKDVYNGLPPEKQHELDFFIWVGCCMHKDQNSFSGGNKAMMEWWKTSGIPGPILLANKENAKLIRSVLDPSKAQSPLSETEAQAIEASTFGGAKLAALAGAIFNNKDGKKGYGDTYANSCREKLGTSRRFPDTSNTRFNSHADAAAFLLTHLDFHLDFLCEIKYKKQKTQWTNIETNVNKGLRDDATLTELAVMVLYAQAVTHPYMDVVRGSGTSQTNALNLGPLHRQVRDHCRQIIDNPELLVGPDASCQLGTLDGKKWHYPEAVEAIKRLLPRLPHIIPATRAFFTGALATWERFSAEFAPGGLIDTANANERELAWMSSTNDVNEGILGAYRVAMRDKPSLTLHQANARLLFNRNHTQEFIDALLDDRDHVYIRKKARQLDASGLEKKRRQAQAEFDRQMAEMKMQKEADIKRAKAERVARLSAIVLMKSSEIFKDKKVTVKILDGQLDKLREIHGYTEIPCTSKRGRKADRMELARTFLQRFEIVGPLRNATEVTEPAEEPLESWEEDEIEAEMENGLD